MGIEYVQCTSCGRTLTEWDYNNHDCAVTNLRIVRGETQYSAMDKGCVECGKQHEDCPAFKHGCLVTLQKVREMVMREPVTRERHTKKGVKIRIAGSGEGIHDICQKIDAMIAVLQPNIKV